MKVSIIVPNYNHSIYLKQRIDSILCQTYQDFELIILDDKSTDNSVEIIEEYRGDKRVSHIVLNEINSGNTFKQWAKGFAIAKGEYIWIAESDDYADSHFLELCVKGLDQNPNTAICFSDSYFVDEHNRELEDTNGLDQLILPTDGDQTPPDLNRGTDSQIIRYNGFDLFRYRLINANYIYNASMVLFRRSMLKSLSNTYTTFRGCGDWFFWGELIINNDVARVPQKLNYFRQHQNKVSAKNTINSNHIVESVNVKQYLLSILTAEAKRRHFRKREILSMQNAVINDIFALIEIFRTEQPFQYKTVREMTQRVKYSFWNVCYVQHYKERVNKRIHSIIKKV